MKNKEETVKLEYIRQPKKVKVLVLSENKTTIKDFYIFKNFSELMKMDLAYNKIVSFPIGFSFSNFSKLRSLFLHYNKINSIKHLVVVAESQSLIYLTLFGNPLEEAKARHFCINQITNLKLMDDKIVKLEERFPDLVLRDIPIQPLKFPLIQYPQQEPANLYFQAILKELYIIRRLYIAANPIIKIQRWWHRRLRKVNASKWKSINLKQIYPIVQCKKQTQEAIAKYNSQVITEKYTISKSYEEKIMSLFCMNLQFWSWFRTEILNNQYNIYIRQDFCVKHNLPYERQKPKFREIKNIKSDFKKTKNFLLFFLYLHESKYLVPHKNMSSINQSKFKKQLLKNPSYRNIPQRLSISNLQQKQNQSYVICKIKDQIQLYRLIKDEYFKCKLQKKSWEEYPFLFEKLMLKHQASVKIQKHWKGYMIRKQYNIHNNFLQKNAIIKIQRWIRSLKFVHRHKFLLQISSHLKKQNNNYIILELDKLISIQKYCEFKDKNGNLFVIPFQKNKFIIQKISEQIKSSPQDQKIKIIFFAERNPALNYVSENLQIKIQNSIFHQKQWNMLDILIKQAKQIIKFSDGKGQKYIKCIYNSVTEAKSRKFILGLKTYQFRRHQFIESSTAIVKLPEKQVKMYQEMSEPYLISIININNLKDNEVVIKKNSRNMIERQLRLITKQSRLNRVSSSVNSNKSQIQLMMKCHNQQFALRIKYFQANIDYSCILLIKPAQFLKNENIAKKQILLEYQNMSKNNSDSHNKFLLPSATYHYRYENHPTLTKISRNIIHLTEIYPPKSNRYTQELNTDQSQSILTSLNHQMSEENLKFTKRQNFDKFDKEVYPAFNQSQKDDSLLKKQKSDEDELQVKKQKIKQFKMIHESKIVQISQQKQKNLKNFKKYNSLKEQMMQKQLHDQHLELMYDKSKRYQHLRDKFKKQSISIQESGKFQEKFIQLGNSKIKKQLLQFETKRRLNSEYKIHQVQKDVEISQRNKSAHKNIFKTEIKQFSIILSEKQDQSSVILKNSAVVDHIQNQIRNQILEKLKQQRKSQQKIKSQNENKMELSASNSQSFNKNDGSYKSAEQSIINTRQKKQLKKKRIVHSVFPEEFYPLKQSETAGFQLPKIKK